MIQLLASLMVRRAYRLVNEGDLEGLLATFADDARLVFPGTSTWAGDYRGKEAVRRFLQRVIANGLQYRVHDVLVKGPPWNMTIVIVVSDQAVSANGEVVYANRAVEYCKARWGRLFFCEVFEDTERSLAWDRVLTAA